MWIDPPACTFSFFAPDCECDPIEIDRTSQIVKEYNECPKKAVCRACGCDDQPIDPEMLKAITTVVIRREEIRTTRLAKHLTRMILDGYTSPPPSPEIEDEPYKPKRCHWELPLVGLLNMLYAIRRDGKTGREDCTIVGHICGDYRRILDVVMKDLPKLLPAGRHADHMRNTVVKFLALLVDDKDFKKSVLFT